MSISLGTVISTQQLWPQGDARDPLGIWGFRQLVTADASGGTIKVTGEVPAGRGAANVFTCYAVNIAQLTGTPISVTGKCRLLTNWPNVDLASLGVQAFATLRTVQISGDADFTPPVAGQFNADLVHPNDRFLLLYDPRPATGQIDIVELEYGTNVDTDTLSFEAYGYYWDRSVMQTPGGPRHPGSS